LEEQRAMNLFQSLRDYEDYGYELWRNHEKLAWYDAQPHPNDPELATT